MGPPGVHLVSFRGPPEGLPEPPGASEYVVFQEFSIHFRFWARLATRPLQKRIMGRIAFDPMICWHLNNEQRASIGFARGTCVAGPCTESHVAHKSYVCCLLACFVWCLLPRCSSLSQPAASGQRPAAISPELSSASQHHIGQITRPGGMRGAFEPESIGNGKRNIGDVAIPAAMCDQFLLH